MKVLKQVAGIDVAQKELVVSLGRMHENLTTEIYAYKVFANKPEGFKALHAWVEKFMQPEIAVHYVMEATGVYHESFAYYLAEQQCTVSIVMPNKISNYIRTLDLKTITDKTSSQAIASFGLEKSVRPWNKPDQKLRELKQLTREREQLIDERTALKNQLHAENAEVIPNSKTINRIQDRISLLDKQQKEILSEIAIVTKQQPTIKTAVATMTSIPGIGLLTAATVLAETNGFELIRNKKQLTSYAGLDVREKESGTSVKAKPRISKKGNRHLRKAMHLPALTAIRHDERFKAIYDRLVAKHGIKMKALVAVQRKLLELCYCLYKTNQPYDKKRLLLASGSQEVA
jgi:transposase